jgi:hypothetical protein
LDFREGVGLNIEGVESYWFFNQLNDIRNGDVLVDNFFRDIFTVWDGIEYFFNLSWNLRNVFFK